MSSLVQPPSPEGTAQTTPAGTGATVGATVVAAGSTKKGEGDDDPRIAKLYDVAKAWANTRQVSVASVITFVTYLISSAESLVREAHAGEFKKSLIMTVLHKVVEHDIPFQTDDDRQAVLAVIDLAVPVFIDTAIGIAKGDIDIGKIFVSCSACCGGGKSSAATLPSGAPPQP